jgi:ribosomal protein S18 acetylase RimI-like enzyme
VEPRLKGKGCMRMYLLVYPENRPAIDFYEKRNYKKMNVDVYGKDLL